VLIASCACGSVELQVSGTPIVGVVCYCDDCQEGGRRIAALAKAGPVQDPDGGTAYLLYRKDRLECVKGAPLLKGLKLKEKSPTNRVVATCCNSAMVLNFDDGKPWVSVYRRQLAGDVPPPTMRICTRFSKRPLSDDIPRHSGFPLRFAAKICAAWIPMLLGR
jgi:hypothetical protein